MSNYIVKGRVWAFVLYPDSCIDYLDMIKKLECLGVPVAVSPLHMPEKNTESENEKKHHFHCLMYFNGQKKQTDLKFLTDMSLIESENNLFNWRLLCDKDNPTSDFNKTPYFMKVHSLRAQFRYLIHLDNPEKQQFPDYKITNFVNDEQLKYNNIVLLNGFEEKDYLKTTYSCLEFELLNMISENDIETVSQLFGYLERTKNVTMLNYIKKNLYWIKNAVCSRLWYNEARAGLTTTTS